jgi:hypothetical protein
MCVKAGVLPLLLSEYHPKDIFHAEECGLFLSLVPDKTHAFKDENVHEVSRSIYEITVLIFANMNGYEKMPLLVTAKSETPRCFKHMKSLPCIYRHNSRAWKI